MNQIDKTLLFDENFPFSDDDFEKISSLAHREFGLFLPPPKKTLVYSRLARRVRSLKLRDFKDYCDLLQDDKNREERRVLLSSLTTNVTQFFREAHHFDYLSKSVFPELISLARAGSPVRIWSAGCSTGQEPYSIAFTLLDAFPDAPSYDVKILATDIDTEVLETGKRAVYSDEDIAPIPKLMRERFVTQTEKNFRVKDTVKKLVNFAELNLVSDWNINGKFHLIMCRNVSIYFDKSAQATLWKRFSDQIRPNGHLLIGHSERLSGDGASAFKTVGVTAYERALDR